MSMSKVGRSVKGIGRAIVKNEEAKNKDSNITKSFILKGNGKQIGILTAQRIVKEN